MPPRARRQPPDQPTPGQPPAPDRLLFDRIEINWEVLDALCGVRATLAEIASHFNCSEDTIQRRVMEEKQMSWSEFYRFRSGSGAIALRRKQMQVALNGNVTMLIWLGKQMLGQMDQAKQQLELTGAGGGPVEVNTTDVRDRIAARLSGISERMGATVGTVIGTAISPPVETPATDSP